MLNLSCIFSILVSRLFICDSILISRFWLNFTIIIRNSLSDRFPIFSSVVWFGGHLSYSFTCWVFLCLFILFKLLSLGCPFLLGASVRHSARGKGHEEGGSTYAKAGSSLRRPPGNPWASTLITRACLLYYFVLPPTPLTLWGAAPTTSFEEGVKRELQLIKTTGCDKSVLIYNLLWRFSSLPDRLVRPHVIAYSLPTVRGTRCFKPSKNRFLRKVRKLLV